MEEEVVEENLKSLETVKEPPINDIFCMNCLISQFKKLSERHDDDAVKVVQLKQPKDYFSGTLISGCSFQFSNKRNLDVESTWFLPHYLLYV